MLCRRPANQCVLNVDAGCASKGLYQQELRPQPTQHVPCVSRPLQQPPTVSAREQPGAAGAASIACAVDTQAGGTGGWGGGATPRTRGRRSAGGGDGGGGGGGPGGGSSPSHSFGGSWHGLQQLLQRLLTLLAAGLALPAAAAASTVAANKASKAASKAVDTALPPWELDAFVDRMWGLSGPILNNMGFSGLLGACAAAALKWVGRTVAASLGIGLILIQVLSHYNVITVNWSVVHKQARQVLDRTGDGRLDQDDFKRVVKQGLIILSEGVPSLSGFLVGFLVGLRLF